MKILLRLFLFLTTLTAYSQEYKISINLTQVKKDKVKIEVTNPGINENNATYVMPNVIPGSYARKEYGRFIEKFTAVDINGKKLKVIRKNNSEFEIINAKNLDKISYWINDSWDDSNKALYIFQPGGTNIEKDKNFVLNHFGYYGYFENYKMLPYKITVTKPENFYASGAIKKTHINETTDILEATDYVNLADMPVMYCLPDTLSFVYGKTKIHISTYAPKNKISSEFISLQLFPLIQGLKAFLTELPVNEYHFIFYFADLNDKALFKNGGFGALEHNKSSFYFLPEIDNTDYLASIIRDIAAHEFLHIITPLNLHSKEIADFDFLDPKMSQHLWLYEGVTEYFSHLAQLKAGLISEEAFMQVIQEKINNAEKYPAVSFTEMSKQILVDPYKDMYLNVYEKGALLGFLLDIRMNEVSEGKQSLLSIIQELIKKYGPDRPFDDDQLLEDIASLSNTEIREFINDYIKGDKPLPYKEYFSNIGWNYIAEKKDTIFSFGELPLKLNEHREVILSSSTKNNFKLESKDIILKINNIPLNKSNSNILVEQLKTIIEPGSEEEVSLVVKRKKATMNLTAKPEQKVIKKGNTVSILKDFSPKQKSLRSNVF